MSEASRPVAIRTSVSRGASVVASTTRHCAVDRRLDDGVEVHRGQPGGVDRHQPGRDVAGPQHGDHQVGEVAADALARQQRLGGAVGVPAGAADVEELGADPGADGVEQLPCPRARRTPPTRSGRARRTRRSGSGGGRRCRRPGRPSPGRRRPVTSAAYDEPQRPTGCAVHTCSRPPSSTRTSSTSTGCAVDGDARAPRRRAAGPSGDGHRPDQLGLLAYVELDLGGDGTGAGARRCSWHQSHGVRRPR